jgi:hypothetical protein
MRVTRIIIGRREYYVPAEESPESIMARVTEQVRAGGGFVELIRSPQRTVNVLISPGMNLSIEVVHVEDVSGAAGSAGPEPWEGTWLDPLDLV